jgi:hypothetical protein
MKQEATGLSALSSLVEQGKFQGADGQTHGIEDVPAYLQNFSDDLLASSYAAAVKAGAKDNFSDPTNQQAISAMQLLARERGFTIEIDGTTSPTRSFEIDWIDQLGRIIVNGFQEIAHA